MMKLSPQMKKILMIIGLIIAIGIVIYLIVSLTSKSKKTTSTRRLRSGGMIRENYENIVLQVTSFCGNGNVFNNKTNRCSVDTDYTWNITTNNQIMLADITNTPLITLDFNKVNDQFFADQTNLSSGTQYNVDTAIKALTFIPILAGRKRTIIPLTYSTTLFAPATTTQTAIANVTAFINSSVIQTMLKSRIPTGNSTGIPSRNILTDTNTTITLDSNGQNLIITSQWKSPYVFQKEGECILNTTTNTWIAKRRFDLSQDFVTPITTPDIYQENILKVGGTYLFPLGASNVKDVPCPIKKDCKVAPKSSSGTVLRKTDGTYDFNLTLTFDITELPNADGLSCNNPTLYPNLNVTSTDITQDLTAKLVTITKKVNLSYSSAPIIDTKTASPGLQLLVKTATNFTGNKDAEVINNYAGVFTDFYGDISRLPLLVLSATGTNKVFNNIQNGLITTNIVGQKLYGSDLNLDNSNTQLLVKNMVRDMTGIVPDNITSLGIFNTFKIKSGTIQLYAQPNGALTANAAPPTSLTENDKLWIFVKTGTDTGYIQHLSSFKYLPGGTGNLTQLVDNKDATNLLKSSFNFANNGNGTIQLNSNNTFLTISASTVAGLNNVNWSATSSTLTFETSSVSDPSLGLLNSILSSKSWTQLSTTASTSNMLAANTTADLIPSTISLDGQGKAIFNGTVDRTNSSTDPDANTNLAIYNNLNNLPNTSLSQPRFVRSINNLRYVFWDNSASSGMLTRTGTISGITFGNANVINNNIQDSASQWTTDEFYQTSPPDGQYQWVNSGGVLGSVTARFYIDSNKALRGAYTTTGDKLLSGLMTSVRKFSTWANQSSTEIRILYSRNVNTFNNLTLIVINSPTDFTNNTYISSTESTLFPDNTTGFIADWVALNGSRAMVTDTNNNLYYTPDVMNTNNPIWMKVNTPEPVKVVDFKNNYAAIITTTNKVYVANNF